MKSRLSDKNNIMTINKFATSLRYGAGIMKWPKNKLDEIDRNTTNESHGNG